MSHPECGGPLVEYVCILGLIAITLTVGFANPNGGLGYSIAGNFETLASEIGGTTPNSVDICALDPLAVCCLGVAPVPPAA